VCNRAFRALRGEFLIPIFCTYGAIRDFINLLLPTFCPDGTMPAEKCFPTAKIAIISFRTCQLVNRQPANLKAHLRRINHGAHGEHGEEHSEKSGLVVKFIL
jgi:hypothetical protein